MALALVLKDPVLLCFFLAGLLLLLHAALQMRAVWRRYETAKGVGESLLQTLLVDEGFLPEKALLFLNQYQDATQKLVKRTWYPWWRRDPDFLAVARVILAGVCKERSHTTDTQKQPQ